MAEATDSVEEEGISEISEIKSELGFLVHQMCVYLKDDASCSRCVCDSCRRKLDRVALDAAAEFEDGSFYPDDTVDEYRDGGANPTFQVDFYDDYLSGDDDSFSGSDDENDFNADADGGSQDENENGEASTTVKSPLSRKRKHSATAQSDEDYSPKSKSARIKHTAVTRSGRRVKRSRRHRYSSSSSDSISTRDGSSSDGSNNVSGFTPRGRGASRLWTQIHTFDSAADAAAFMKNENWARHGLTHTSEGRKIYLRCMYAARSIPDADRCRSERYLLYDRASGKVHLYWNEQEHRHTENYQRTERGLSDQMKDFIVEQYEAGVRKPGHILVLIRRRKFEDEPIPHYRQIVSFLKTYKKANYNFGPYGVQLV